MQSKRKNRTTRNSNRFSSFTTLNRRKQPAKKWRKLSWLICGVILYGGYVYLGGSTGLIQYWKLYQKRSKFEKEISTLEARQDSLKQVIHLLQNDTTYIEKVARERYYMGRPDETIYTVVKQPESEGAGK